jgi:hypothetical protein
MEISMNAGQNDPKDIDSSEHEDAAEIPTPLEPVTTEPITDAAPLAPELEEPKPESKARVFFRKLFRSTLGFLIIFGIGFAVAAYTIYKPAVAENNRTVGQLADAQAQIADLSAQISALQSAVVESDAKLAEQSNFELHVAVLSARVDISNAQLALAEDNAAGAHLALEKTDEILALIKSLMPVEQGDEVVDMEQRLERVLTEITEKPYAAISDLYVLATDLLRLEDDTFGLR